jgi:hypothetical protein
VFRLWQKQMNSSGDGKSRLGMARVPFYVATRVAYLCYLLL